MNVTITETTAHGREIAIQIAASQVDALLDQELNRLAGTVKLPGFRPGKIPKKVLEARFRDHLARQLTEQLIRESYAKALEENGLLPTTDQPVLTIGDLRRGHAFGYTAAIEVYPTVEPKEYTSLTLTRRTATVDEADVARVLDNLRAAHARFEAQADRKAEGGDQVVLDYVGSVDGTPFDGGQAEGHVLELGSGRFIPGFETQLVGCGAEERRQVRVTFPETYHATHLAGKEALFECTIREVRQRILPPIDDVLAERTGIRSGGVDAMRREIQKQLQERGDAAREQQLQEAIAKQLLAHHAGLEVPDSLLERECLAMVARAKREMKTQGMDPDALGMADADMAKNFSEQAKDRLTVSLVLHAIAKKEQITLDESAVQARVDKLVSGYGEQAGRMRQWFSENDSQLDSLRATLTEEKVMAWLCEHNTVTEERCSYQDLVK